MSAITKFIDDYLTKSGKIGIDPVEANALLEKAGILRDSKNRPGKPLRDLLRKGQLPHAFQAGGKGSSWTIPHSSKGKSLASNYSSTKPAPKTQTLPKSVVKKQILENNCRDNQRTNSDNLHGQTEIIRTTQNRTLGRCRRSKQKRKFRHRHS